MNRNHGGGFGEPRLGSGVSAPFAAGSGAFQESLSLVLLLSQAVRGELAGSRLRDNFGIFRSFVVRCFRFVPQNGWWRKLPSNCLETLFCAAWRLCLRAETVGTVFSAVPSATIQEVLALQSLLAFSYPTSGFLRGRATVYFGTCPFPIV